LGQSENLAQETFLTAWQHLGRLREPGKLRSWLCGIARHLIHDSLRREGRQPLRQAETLEAVQELPAAEPWPSERAISQEEQAILWRSLERIPEPYREPLILFYRESQSVAQTAVLLELTEDAVKQRLSRGRKLLAAEVTAFVEGALRQSAPGRAFTLGVLAALPVFATSASAATVAAAAAQGSAVAKSASLVAVFNALLGPMIGILGAYLGVRASLDATRTPRERQFVVRQTKLGLLAALLFNVVLAAYIFVAVKYWAAHVWLFAALGIGIPLAFTTFILVAAARHNRELRRIREEERRRHPDLFDQPEAVAPWAFKEYRSRWTLFGLPLVHVRCGAPAGEKVRPAVGWIALGDRAVGVLFAAGGVAVGAVSLGGVSIGLIALGGVSAGLLALGGFAVGGLALGGAAVGIVAAGGFATGWLGAEGGLAVAREFALGGQAIARHANDAAAREFFNQYPWLDLTKAANRNWFVALCWMPMVFVVWQAIVARRRTRRQRTARSSWPGGNPLQLFSPSDSKHTQRKDSL
jgi:RNA polymerase sigma factor (sigma-70 family)